MLRLILELFVGGFSYLDTSLVHVQPSFHGYQIVICKAFNELLESSIYEFQVSKLFLLLFTLLLEHV